MPDELVIRTDRTPTSDIPDPGKVVTLALNRPDKLNALTPQVFASLRAHIDDLAGDESVGCVVLAGQGRSFCAGNDLGGISRRDTEAASVDALPPLLAPETVDALESLPMPTIGRIQGHCFTGGLELALLATCWWQPKMPRWATHTASGDLRRCGVCRCVYPSELVGPERRNSCLPLGE